MKRSDIKVGQEIQHNMCKIKGTVSFIAPKYLVYEVNGDARVLPDEQYDMWSVLPETFQGISVDVLERAYVGASNFHWFMLRLKKYQQDFKESSLP